ncbi:MAG: ribosome small subunit-dependent GTPase A [Erysipelothrix sp.]|nr:ribosome small subunit-dependent GTPase A [Erysipelothrix sp.]
MIKGRIIRLISNRYQVLLDSKEIVDTIASGKLRLKMAPKTGDIVKLEIREEKYMIVDILDRFNDLRRPPIANIDQMLIVVSAKDPDFSVSLVDQMLVMSNFHRVKPVLIISKMDLLDKDDKINLLIDNYVKSGYRVIKSGKDKDTGEIEKIVANKFSVLSGQSGVGKSTLLNRINPDFEIKTQEISQSLGRGKHTTRHVQYLPVGSGWVADTPGFSKIDLTVLTIEDLRDAMFEFEEYSALCRFSDCFHIKEPGCGVIKAVEAGLIPKERYENYLKFNEEIADVRRLY